MRRNASRYFASPGVGEGDGIPTREDQAEEEEEEEEEEEGTSKKGGEQKRAKGNEAG